MLHVVTSTDRRGAETAAIRVSDALRERQWSSEVVALAAGRFGGLDVPVLGRRPLSVSALRTLRARCAEVAIVVSHGSTTLPAVAAATVGTSTPFIYRSIGDPTVWVNTPARRARVRVATAQAAWVVPIWRGAALAWHEQLRVPAHRITVIPNAVRSGEFEPASPDDRRAACLSFGLDPGAAVALCLGALSPEKRFDVAAQAVTLLQDVQLLVVGDGPMRTELAALGGRVRVVGPTAEPQRALAAADVLVLPSATEGQPAVAIEAALSGVPVVAAAVGGMSELVDHGRTGLLLKPPVGADRLSAAITEAITDRNRFGDAGRELALRQFDLPRIADEWNRLLSRTVK